MKIDLPLIKIGRSNDPQARLAALQTACGRALRLLGVIYDSTGSLEGTLHRRFACDRRQGEWFVASATLVDFIRVNAKDGALETHETPVDPS